LECIKGAEVARRRDSTRRTSPDAALQRMTLLRNPRAPLRCGHGDNPPNQPRPQQRGTASARGFKPPPRHPMRTSSNTRGRPACIPPSVRLAGALVCLPRDARTDGRALRPQQQGNTSARGFKPPPRRPMHATQQLPRAPHAVCRVRGRLWACPAVRATRRVGTCAFVIAARFLRTPCCPPCGQGDDPTRPATPAASGHWQRAWVQAPAPSPHAHNAAAPARAPRAHSTECVAYVGVCGLPRNARTNGHTRSAR